jgi:hypothetical protein
LPAGRGAGRDAGIAGEAGDAGVAGVGGQGAGVRAIPGGLVERGVPQVVRRPAGAAAS